jgi:hypothetical protein
MKLSKSIRNDLVNTQSNLYQLTLDMPPLIDDLKVKLQIQIDNIHIPLFIKIINTIIIKPIIH